jgi:hypothetical protein
VVLRAEALAAGYVLIAVSAVPGLVSRICSETSSALPPAATVLFRPCCCGMLCDTTLRASAERIKGHKGTHRSEGSDAGKAAEANREWQVRTGVRLLNLEIKYLIQSYVKPSSLTWSYKWNLRGRCW